MQCNVVHGSQPIIHQAPDSTAEQVFPESERILDQVDVLLVGHEVLDVRILHEHARGHVIRSFPVHEVGVVWTGHVLDGRRPRVLAGLEHLANRQRVRVQCRGDDAAETILVIVIKHVELPHLAVIFETEPRVRVALDRDVGNAISPLRHEGQAHARLPGHPNVVPGADVGLDQQAVVAARVICLRDRRLTFVRCQASEGVDPARKFRGVAGRLHVNSIAFSR
mmetsp:Transcript_84047/g.187605  ORF Transcript_84047/g.187605 Transcript_84047/m.187605 type:complete len:223 (+) Transcript_84047:457-1125(+)